MDHFHFVCTLMAGYVFAFTRDITTVYNLRIPFNLSVLASNPKSNLIRWKLTCHAWIWIIVKFQNSSCVGKCCSISDIFLNFNLSIWVSKFEINLSGSNIYSSQTIGRVLWYSLSKRYLQRSAFAFLMFLWKQLKHTLRNVKTSDSILTTTMPRDQQVLHQISENMQRVHLFQAQIRLPVWFLNLDKTLREVQFYGQTDKKGPNLVGLSLNEKQYLIKHTPC